MFEFLDANGYRIGPRHSNSVRLQPGETRTCIGCHDTSMDPLPVHGRPDAEPASTNAGLPSGLVFINTEIPGSAPASPYWGDLGQTMAEVRFSRAGDSNPPAPEPRVTYDLIYEDYWTDPDDPAVRDPDDSFSYRYEDPVPTEALSTPVPFFEADFCTPAYLYNCRISINYEEHLHALWGNNIGSGGVDRGANTCVNCHNPTTIAGLATPLQLGFGGQLDLTDGISDQDADLYNAYQELTATDLQQVDDGGMLINVQITVDILDGDGNVIGTQEIDDPNATVAPSMSANGARASYFIEKLTSATATRAGSLASTDAGYVDHSGMMTDIEIKLIAEWLDIGAQYFNNPYHPDVPQN